MARCEACGQRKPQFATGYGKTSDGKVFRYLGSKLCMMCRHARVLPGRLAITDLRRVR